MEKKMKRIKTLWFILGSVPCLLFWSFMLFFSFFLGGSPGPGLERTVPIPYAAIVGLGFIGSIIGFITN